MPASDPTEKWFLNFSKKTYGWSFDGGGRPWGDGTEMAKREGDARDPWDKGCKVTPMIGGYEAMNEIRESLEKAIGQGPGLPEDQRGHVYIADWRFNPLRDLSEVNDWGTKRPWTAGDAAQIDQTAMGFFLRLMQVGVRVRILLWLPMFQARMADLGPHIDDHFYTAKVVKAECDRLNAPDRGIVALDLRVATPPGFLAGFSGSHHQKMMVIRVGDVNVAYVGGVDLAFTRRDAPDDKHTYEHDRPQFLGGDWQSGDSIKNIAIKDTKDKTHRWPKAPDVNYDCLKKVSDPSPQVSDLPKEVYGDSNQIWHDQHLMLEGPIVKTLEEQFCERWSDSGRVFDLGLTSNANWSTNQIIFSDKAAYDASKKIIPLPKPKPVAEFSSPGSSLVQMWRTIPLRKDRVGAMFKYGEFTVMAGIEHACKQATELIWIFDQYFWSRPLAKLLNDRLKEAEQLQNNLYVLIVLPPYADTTPLAQHHERKLALNQLTSGLHIESTDPKLRQYGRVGVYNLWHPPDKNDPQAGQKYPKGRGIYVHAKVQMYDRSLLVCGSANLNRRSFTCDTELDCAILDSFVVAEHQRRLWNVLFPDRAWPSHIDFNQKGWGKQFFAEFRDAVGSEGACLIPDPWWKIDVVPQRTYTRKLKGYDGDITEETHAIVKTTPPTLPNGVSREQDYGEDYLDEIRRQLNQKVDVIDLKGQEEWYYIERASALQPSSITTQVEEVTCKSADSSADPKAPGRLDEIVYLIEGCDDHQTWPWRRQ